MAPTIFANFPPVYTPNAVLQDQPSPAFLATVVNAVRQALSAKQTSSLSASNSLARMSVTFNSGGVPAQPTSLSQLDSQTLSLASSGVGFSPSLPVEASSPA